MGHQEQNPALPDEIELLDHSSVGAYTKAFDSMAGRAYRLMHGAVFELGPGTSRSAWAATGGGASEPKLPAVHWPAAAGGALFADARSTAVYLVLSTCRVRRWRRSRWWTRWARCAEKPWSAAAAG